MSTAAYSQANRPMAVTTPLGQDALLLVSFMGQEGISQLFAFQLDVLAKNNQEVPFEKLLGQPLTVELALAQGTNRYFHGICNRVSQGARDYDFTAYRLVVVPQLWLLTKKAQSRIFQHLTVKQILKKVLEGLDVVDQTQGKFHPRDYCVQYRETDFNFACRLMEEEGIFYFFKHSAQGHQLVLANTPQSHPELPEQSRLIYEEIEANHDLGDDRIHFWEKAQELRSGKYTLWDHSFELPHKHLEASKMILPDVQVGEVTHQLKTGGNEHLELYDYPGEYAQRFDGVDRGGGDRSGELQKIFEDNERTASIRIQEEAVPGLVIRGASNYRQLVSGYWFDLERHFNANGRYLLTSVQHTARLHDYRSGGAEFHYHNNFTCIPLALPYRPARVTPKPFVQGTQTATVVGHKGEEICTDKYGRVKVKFPWDRDPVKHADSSCWIRVAQPLAGKGWGTFFLPRVGQEVVVAFQEGDPDQPIIVGSVYNAEQIPHYVGNGPDPQHRHNPRITGYKSCTTPGGNGFNELRFDDTKGKEQVFIHAQRNLDVRIKASHMHTVGGSHHLTVGGKKDGKKAGDQNEMVYQDKNVHIHRHQVEHIEGNARLTVGDGEAEGGGNLDVMIEKTKKELIGQDAHLHVKGKQMALVDGTQDLTVKGDKKELVKSDSHLHVASNRNETIDGTQFRTVRQDQHEKVGKNHALEAGMEIHLKAGMKVIIEAGAQLSLKGPGGFIDIGPEGVAIQGTMVLINSGGAAAAGSGSKPETAQDAQPPEDAKKAEPSKPAMADDAKTGEKSASG
jgi:type VI secretion system secreted protein VgrG